MMQRDPSNAADSIVLRMPDAVRDYGGEAFHLTLMQELLAQAKTFEPEMMRRGGGWLSGPIDPYVTSASASEDGTTIEVTLHFHFQTQTVPGCGTSAVGSIHDLSARLTIDRDTGLSHLRFSIET